MELTVHNPSAPDGGTVFLNQSLNRKLQRRKYVEYENLCWKCEGLIHLKHSSLINCSKRKRLVWTALVESKEASAHSFCLWGTDNELHFFKKKQSLFSGKESTYRQEFAPKTRISNKILLLSLWEKGFQLLEQQLFCAPCPYSPVSLLVVGDSVTLRLSGDEFEFSFAIPHQCEVKQAP